MKLCIPTLCNYDGVDELIRSAEAGNVKPEWYIVVDNGGGYNEHRGYDPPPLDHVVSIMGSDLASRIDVITPGANLGVAASWNLFLERYGKDEPIVISNDDIVLGPSAFQTLTVLSEHVAHAGYGWALFMQRPDCTEKVGYYDENFWPAYHEDIDYIIRMRKAGVPECRLEGKIDIQHAGWTAVNQLGDPSWLADGRDKNRSYLIAKWGADEYGTPYAEPFNGKPPTGWDLRKRLPALPLRWDLVNEIAAMICAERYLELGLADGSCIRRITVPERVGVDIAPPPPAPGCDIHTMPTDEFFRTYTGEKFDLVFVDADHAWEQAYRDVQNAIRHLNPGGVVVMHDCSPFSKDMQIVPHNGHYLWTGDVWKAVVKLRWEGQHATRVVDSNYGLGIVIPGGAVDHLPRRPRKPETLTYEDLVAEREGLLGLLSGWEWREWFEAAYEPVALREGAAYISAGLGRASSAESQGGLSMVEPPSEYFAQAAGVSEYYAGGHPWHTMGDGLLKGPGQIQAFPREVQSISVLGHKIGPLPEQDKLDQPADTRIGDGEEKARRREVDADTSRDTLAVVFSVLPRADTTGTHLLKAFERLGVKTRYHEPLRKVDGIGLCEGLGGMDVSDACAILCIDDDHGWRVPITRAPHVPTYYWCIDTYRMDAELYLGGTRRARVKEFDKVFYVQKKEADECGGTWLPVGVDLTQYRYEPAKKLYDFCFIGNRNAARDVFIGRLKQEFPRSFVGNAYGEEANQIYNQSHIAINYSAGGDINMRMFESQATSALLLSNRIDNGEADLLPYLWLYESYDDCVASMRCLLRHPTACRSIAAAQANSVESHTYEERARTFLKEIGWELPLDMSRFPGWQR